MLTPPTRSRARLASLGLVLSLAVGVAGCASGSPAAEGPVAGSGTSADSGTAATPAETPSTTTTITCDQIAELAAPITAAFQFSPDDSSEYPTGTSCVWINDDALAGGTDIENYGTLAVTIDSTGWSADDLVAIEQTGTVIDDPRAGAVDGRILLLSDGDTLGEVGSLQLLFPAGTVTIVVTGALMSTGAPDLAIPVDDAIGVAADVAALKS